MSVKQALIIPLRYVLLLLVFMVIIAGYAILTSYARFEYLSGSGRSAEFLLYLLGGMKSGLFLGGMIATLFSIRVSLGLKKGRVVSLLLLFLVSYALLFFGYYVLHGFEKTRLPEDHSLVTDLPARTILEFEGGGIFFNSSQPLAFENAVVYHYGNLSPNSFDDNPEFFRLNELDSGIPRLSWHSQLPYDSTRGEIIVTGRAEYTDSGESLVIPAGSMENSRQDLFSHRGLISDIGSVLSGLFVTLDLYADDFSFRYAALTGSLVLFLFSTLVFLRLTRWPLVNMILSLLVNVGGLFLTRIGELEVVTELSRGFLQERALAYMGPGILVVIALIFMVVNSFLPSINEWASEVGS